MESLSDLPKAYVRMTLISLVLLVLVVLLYVEPFSLTMDPISWLGRLKTEDGTSNIKAFLLFSTILLFNAFKWHEIFTALTRLPLLKPPVFQALDWGIQLGFVLMAFPCDKFGTAHCVGGALVMGGLWALTAALLYLSRDDLGRNTHLWLQFILHLAACFCGINFAYDTILKGFSQRPFLAAIIGELGICFKALFRDQTEDEFVLRWKNT